MPPVYGHSQQLPAAVPAIAAPGLHPDGPLDVGTCRMRGTPGYTSYRAEITVWNPGGSPQHMSGFAVEWGSNGILLSEDTYTARTVRRRPCTRSRRPRAGFGHVVRVRRLEPVAGIPGALHETLRNRLPDRRHPRLHEPVAPRP